MYILGRKGEYLEGLWIEGRMDGWVCGFDVWISELVDGCIVWCMDDLVDGFVVGLLDGCVDGLVDGCVVWSVDGDGGWVCGSVGKRLSRSGGGWVDGWVGEWVSGCVGRWVLEHMWRNSKLFYPPPLRSGGLRFKFPW